VGEIEEDGDHTLDLLTTRTREGIMRFSRGSKRGLLFCAVLLSNAALRGQTISGTIPGSVTDPQPVVPDVRFLGAAAQHAG
jgi:hypothetical protein